MHIFREKRLNPIATRSASVAKVAFMVRTLPKFADSRMRGGFLIHSFSETDALNIG